MKRISLETWYGYIKEKRNQNHDIDTWDREKETSNKELEGRNMEKKTAQNSRPEKQN